MKHAGLVFSFSLLLFGCTSAPNRQEFTQNSGIGTQSPVVIPQYTATSTIMGLDDSIYEGAQYLMSRIGINSKVAIISVEAATKNLSGYIIDNLSMHLVNEDKYVVIERSERKIIEQEQVYQLSGAVSDETAVSIGKQLGTQFIITGSILPLGEKYSLRLKIINVETAQIVGTKVFQIDKDNILIALLESPREQQEVNPTQNTPQTVINNNSVTNNTTTTINGDVYINKPDGFSWE